MMDLCFRRDTLLIGSIEIKSEPQDSFCVDSTQTTIKEEGISTDEQVPVDEDEGEMEIQKNLLQYSETYEQDKPLDLSRRPAGNFVAPSLRQPAIARYRIRCPRCPRLFGTDWMLKTHFNKCHLAPSDFRCGVCGETHPTRGKLVRHMRQHPGARACRLCPEFVTDEADLRAHMAQHGYKCSICFQQFAHDRLLVEHLPACLGQNAAGIQSQRGFVRHRKLHR